MRTFSIGVTRHMDGNMLNKKRDTRHTDGYMLIQEGDTVCTDDNIFNRGTPDIRMDTC
jgi:hypothetical protein